MSKISELSDGGSLVSSDYLIAVRSGGNVKVRMDSINVDQVDLGDNEFIRLGNSQDLTMVHTSTQSIINQAGIGDLLIQKAGATKLTINASGIDVTGSVTADGLIVDDITINGSTISDSGDLTIDTEADLTLTALSDITYQTTSTNSSAGHHIFKSYNTEIMRIDGGSNSVGIGTSLPNKKLTVTEPQTANTAMEVLRLSGSGVYSSGGSPNAGAGLSFGQYHDTYPSWNLAQIDGIRTGGSWGGSLIFKTNDNTAQANSTERMRIDASGNVQQATSVNGDLYHHIYNANTGTGAEATLYVSNGSPVSGLFAGATGTNFTTTGGFVQDGAHIGSGGAAAGGLSIITRASAPIRFYTNGHTNERMRIGASGSVGIGVVPSTWSAAYKPLQVGLAGAFWSEAAGATTLVSNNELYNASGVYNRLTTGAANDILLTADGSFFFRSTDTSAAAGSEITDSTTKVKIDPDGNLLVGTTDTTLYNNTSGGGAALMVVGDGIRLDLARDGDVATFNRMSGTGTLLEMRQGGAVVGTVTVTASTTAYNTSSDRRLKENIADADDAGSKIDSIQVRKFDWKVDGSHQDYGMVAQELQAVAPEAVAQGETEDDMMGVDYSKLVPMMLKEIQSLRARIAALES